MFDIYVGNIGHKQGTGKIIVNPDDNMDVIRAKILLFINANCCTTATYDIGTQVPWWALSLTVPYKDYCATASAICKVYAMIGHDSAKSLHTVKDLECYIGTDAKIQAVVPGVSSFC